jgi:catechol 2,3-dioxygenase-like lactoylglutathione lyase family enzyme
MKIDLGTVGHFGLAVRDPRKSARWWRSLFDLRVRFEGKGYVGLANDKIVIGFVKGVPRPKTLGHMSFNMKSMKELRAALDVLKKHRVDVEDPGDEIGPQFPGSPAMGLWFRDPDGYRWELSVQGAAKHRRSSRAKR